MTLWKKQNKKNKWVHKGIICAFMASLLYTACFGVFRDRAKDFVIDPTADENNIAWLYESSYILYRDLYNIQNGVFADYKDIYLKPQEGFDWLLNEQSLYDFLNGSNTPILEGIESIEITDVEGT